MNTEQLQLVLNALQQLGVEGKAAFIWWLVLDKLTPVVITAIVMGSIGYILVKLMYNISYNTKLENLRDAMSIGSPGVVTNDEYQRMLTWVSNRSNK